MKRIFAIGMMFLLLSSISTQVPDFFNSRPEKGIDITPVSANLDPPSEYIGTRESMVENDEFGGSWFDTFGDETGIESKENVDVDNDEVRLGFDISPRPGCVGYWNFDEGSGNTAHDRTENGNDATLHNMNNNDWINGKRGNALEFDGQNDYVDIPDRNIYSIDTSGKLSIEFWLETGNDVTTKQMVIEKGGQSSSGPWEWAIIITEGDIRATTSDSSGDNIRGEIASILPNTAYSVCVIYTGVTKNDEVKIYLNGQKSNSLYISGTRTYSNTQGKLAFGRGYSTQAWRYFSGVLDEVAIFDRELTVNEINNPFYYKPIPYYIDGNVQSKTITPPEDMLWDTFNANCITPQNTYLNLSVHDAGTDGILFQGSSDLNMFSFDLTTLNDQDVNSIYLKAQLQSNLSETSVLCEWGVEWVVENAWRDSFVGDNKIDSIIGSVQHIAYISLNDNELIPDQYTSALWHFNEKEGKNLPDSSGNNNDGIIYEPNWQEGKYGNSLEFDGVDDRIQIEDHTIDGTLDNEEFTVEAWIFPKTGPTNQVIVSKRYNADSQSNYLFYLKKESNLFYPLINYGYGSSPPYKAQSPQPTPLNQWSHVAGTYDGSKLKIFLNGILKNEVDCSAHPIPFKSNSDVFIGCYSQEDTPLMEHLFNGFIDEVAIHDRALTSQEIQLRSKFHHHNATIRSETLTLPENTIWDTFHADRSIPDDAYLNISIHDADTDEMLLEDTGNEDELDFDLSEIDSDTHSSIYLQAELQSSKTETPKLLDWGVSWTSTGSPELTLAIDDIEITEDTPEEDILDLSQHFNDIYSQIQSPVYGLESVSNSNNITLEIADSMLNVAALEENWTGNVSVIVNCTNVLGLSTSSNQFNITVIGVDDGPIWLSTPPSIVLDEDSNHTTDYLLSNHIFDAEGDELEFVAETTEVRITVKIENDTRISISPEKDYFGETEITVFAREAQYQSLFTNTLTIPITVRSVNDLPTLELLSPANGLVVADTTVTLNWMASDLDDAMGNLTYDLYFSDNPSPAIFATDIEKNNITMSDLVDGSTYFWYVVPYDGKNYGHCVNTTWNFTVSTILPTPEISLSTPENNTIFNITEVLLTWTMDNPSGNEVAFTLYLGTASDDLKVLAETQGTQFLLSGLEDNTTYYWKLSADVEGFPLPFNTELWSFAIQGEFKPSHEVRIFFETDMIEIKRGESELVNLTIKNVGNVKEQVNITIHGELKDYGCAE